VPGEAAGKGLATMGDNEGVQLVAYFFDFAKVRGEVGQEEKEDVTQGLAAEHGGPMMAGDNNSTGVKVEGSLMSSMIDMVKKSGTLFHPGMIESLVKVVGMNQNSHSLTCAKHNACCNETLLVGAKVIFRKDWWAWRSKEEKDIVCIHLVSDGSDLPCWYASPTFGKAGGILRWCICPHH
jgi:hypothetical protein